MMRSYAARRRLPARRVFRTSREAKSVVENVFLVLEQDGILAYGEASPNRYFGESAEGTQLALQGLADFLKRQTLRSAADIPRLWRAASEVLASRAALCALDLALWDLWGKQAHRPVAALLWQSKPRRITTAVTLSVTDPGDTEAVAELAGYPLVKVKMDARGALDPLSGLRAHGARRLLVDANAAWTPEQARTLLPRLAELGVEAVEQPLPPARDAEMAALLRDSPLPLLADESCAVPEDLPRLGGRFSGINIKLVKCGGLTPALRMLEQARREGLRVMVGCMLESSLLISAGLALAQRADWSDLDGSWLLAEDPFQGPRFEGGELFPADFPGLGARPARPQMRRDS